jgi:cytochrome c553
VLILRYVAAVSSLTLLACSDAPSGAPTSAGHAPEGASMELRGDAREAQTIFATRCIMCHGKTGGGDGPAAPSLNPKPRNYADATWQASVSDDELKKAITDGGAAVGKSMLMPPNPDLKAKPAVVDELVKLIRSFAKR